jgi:hypothetical protein
MVEPSDSNTYEGNGNRLYGYLKINIRENTKFGRFLGAQPLFLGK